MPDFASPGRTQWPGFPHAKRRKIIVEHKVAEIFPFERIDALLIVRSTQRDHGQALGFPSREQGRAMRARQNTRFACDGPNIGSPPTIGSDFLFQNHLADFMIFHIMIDPFDLPTAHRVLFAKLVDRVGHDLVQPLLPVAFVGDEHGFSNRAGHRFAHLSFQLLTNRLNRHNPLRPPHHRLQFDDFRHDLLDFRMGQRQRIQEHGLGQPIRPGFHHQDRVLGAGDNQIEFTGLEFLHIGVDHELAVHASDFDAG